MPTLVTNNGNPEAPLNPMAASPSGAHSPTSLTLSCNGVQFYLTPTDPTSQVSFKMTPQGVVVLDLENFSGSLQVSPETPPNATASPLAPSPKKVEQEPKSPENVQPNLVTVTPGQQKLGFPKNQKKNTKKRLNDISNNIVKKTKKDQPSLAQSTMELPTQGIDLSQTMPSSNDARSSPDELEDTIMTDSEEPKETVQQILDRVNSTNSVAGDEADDEEPKALEAPMKIETIPEATANPASDLGLSNSYPAACPRWGHTMTKLKNDRLLVYGGQSYDMDGRPIILSDVHVYHPEKKSWEKPINCRGEARQWHSATFLPERQLLLAFGGETYDVFGTKNDKVVTTDSLKVSARFFVYHGTYSVGLKSHFTFSV
jgi:hypothetical protein